MSFLKFTGKLLTKVLFISSIIGWQNNFSAGKTAQIMYWADQCPCIGESTCRQKLYWGKRTHFQMKTSSVAAGQQHIPTYYKKESKDVLL